MATEVRMPKLGATMENGVVSKWLKAEGEPVNKGEPVAEIETEKITNEVEAQGSGVLRRIVVPQGAEAPVGALLAWIAAAGEPLPGEGVPAAPASAPTTSDPADADSGQVKASPGARKLAKEHGVDLALVAPLSSGERVTREDVLAYLAAREPSQGETATPVEAREGASAADAVLGLPVAPAATARVIPLVGMRKAIAGHLVDSLRTSAQLTVANEVDASALVQARESILPGFQLATGVRPTYTDLLALLVCKALQQHPILNSTLVGDQIQLHEDVNLGIAVAVENGLVVPVIHQAQKKSLAEIARVRVDLVAKASEGRLGLDDVTGGTFTITNPGTPGADISTPILNSPENAILGVGRIVKKPVVRDDEICIRHTFWLSVTFDHRAMDGVPVARFLETLGALIENPLPALGGS